MSLLGFLSSEKHSEMVAGSAPPSSLRAGDFTIDVQNREATLNGCILDLTAAEFDLLLYLIKHPKHVITPSMCLATRRSESVERRGDLVRVLLALRAKLEAAESGRRHIHTEPWVFYRFDCAV